MKYSAVTIIYNPNSTGPSRQYAEELLEQIATIESLPTARLVATSHAGHAEEIAYELAVDSDHPLIISSSGDGGYHEVVNGALSAQLEGGHPVCAILPAGNANDHSRTVSDRSLIDALRSGDESNIDVLKIRTSNKGVETTRYAHSYIGLGLTPAVAVELNKTDLSKIKEMAIVWRSFFKLKSFKIIHDERTHKLDSLIFTNIGQMAKILTVSKAAKPDDGKFEVVMFKHATRWSLIKKLVRASVTGLDEEKPHSEYMFTLLKRAPIQLDGEIQYLDAGTEVTITAEHQLLATVY